MGWAFPAAMGAKLANPEQPVVAFLGDGDFMMVMQELATMAQYDIPVIVVLVNNRGWMAIKDLQVDAYGKENTFGNDWVKDGNIYTPDFMKIAEAFGVKAVNISRREEVRPAIEDALKRNRPAFIHVDACRDYPYSGGKAYGWWDVPVPTYDTSRRASYENGKKDEMV